MSARGWKGWRKTAICRSIFCDDASPPDDKPIYRLLTGKDDRAFCERVSEALAAGLAALWFAQHHWDIESNCMKAAQAVVWGEATL